MPNPQLFGQFPGEAGIFQTVSMMRDLVNKNFLNPIIRDKAARIIASCGRDVNCQDRALLTYVNQAIQYVSDPANTEALHDPVTFIEARLRNGQRPYGDCDDFSIYLATLLKAIGHHPRFRVLSKMEDGQLHHICVFCHDKTLDASMKLGNYPRNPTRAIQIDI